jgi:hypothetical protein
MRALRILTFWLVGATALLLPRAALADATPVQLILTHLPNVSNTGPSEASGIAELVLLEGEARLSATGLPALEDPERYVAWLVNTQSNAVYKLAGFNSDGAVARFETVLPDAIPNRSWNLLLVTIETSADAAHPSNKHSIAGTFPRSQSDPPPAQLPNTGGAPELPLPLGEALSRGEGAMSAPTQSDWLPYLGLAALVAIVAGGAGYALGTRAK